MLKMPWYLPWSESIKKRACRYLLQRYLGQFLEEKLTLDQLTVDLYNGRGTVSEVSLDVQALNELGEQQNLPVEFVDGYISEIKVSIPWASLLGDSSFVEVTGLSFIIQPKQRPDNGTSMFESMWSSMTSSMQLAEECLRQRIGDENEAEPLDGLEQFAQTIDSILCRVKVQFVDTVIRLEHVPKDSNTGVAIEVRIKHIDYLDEAGEDCSSDSQPMSGLSSDGYRSFQIAAFTTKKFCFEGVTVYTDEFPIQARTISRSVMSMSTGSTPDSKNSDGPFASAPGSPSHSVSGGNGNSTRNLSLEPDPILCGKFGGRHEIRIKLKQGEGVAGPKVDMGINLGCFTAFLSPRQLHVLLELMHGLSQPDTVDTSNVAPRNRISEKLMDHADFQRVERDLQHHINTITAVQSTGLQDAQAWSSAPLEGESDDEFFAMKGKNSALNESVISNSNSMNSSISSSVSESVSNYSSKDMSGRSSNVSMGSSSQHPNTAKSKSKRGSSTAPESDPSAEVIHFHLRLGSLAVVLLHEDILIVSVDSDGTALAKSSVFQMKALSQSFFDHIGLFSISALSGPSAFTDARDVFLKALPQNHLRLLAASVILEGHERTTQLMSVLDGRLTAASMEVLECLVERNSPTNHPSVEYVELLKFKKEEPQTVPPVYQRNKPDFVLEFKCNEKLKSGPTQKFSQPRTDISISLQSCSSEVDISIIDRIIAVLHPQPMCTKSTSKMYTNPGVWGHKKMMRLNEALDNAPGKKINLKVSAPYLVIKLRFPTPDLRPIHDMDRPPWWKRCVRDDVLFLNLSEANFYTVFDSKEKSSKYNVHFKSIEGLFQEGDSDKQISFIRAHAADESQSLQDGRKGFGWPSVVIQCHPASIQSELEDLPETRTDESMSYTVTPELLRNAARREPSPFCSKRLIHESDTPHGKTTYSSQGEGEELIAPGNKKEIADFINYATRDSGLQFDIHLPCATMQFPSKHVYELIFNRITTDLFLWKSAAPWPKTSVNGGQDLSNQLSSNISVFAMCKSSIKQDSDQESGDNEDETSETNCTFKENRKRNRKHGKSSTGVNVHSQCTQSNVTVSISVEQGVFTVFTPVRDSLGNVIPGQQGELMVQLEEGRVFIVSGYKGSPNLGFICVQLNHAEIFHNGLAPVPADWPELHPVGKHPGERLISTIYRSDASVQEAGSLGPVGVGRSKSEDMVTIALRVQTETSYHIKTFRVATGIRGATLRHRISNSGNSWFSQMKDFFDVSNYSVAGYDPPGVITELYVHLWDCAVDYRPLFLPLKSLLTMRNLTISSNITAQTKTSTLRFLAEDACLLLAEKTSRSESCPIDLMRDYVCVLDLGLFELSLRLCEKTNGSGPRVDLRASNNILHIRTCPDSARALADLISYFAAQGDLASQHGCDGNQAWASDSITSSETSSAGTVREEIISSPSRCRTWSDKEKVPLVQVETSDATQPVLSASQEQHVHSLMAEAMQDTNNKSTQQTTTSPRQHKNNEGVEVFFFPDESQKSRRDSIDSTEDCIRPADPEMNQIPTNECVSDDDSDDSFYFLEEEAGAGVPPRSGVPEVRNLVLGPIHVIDNHFSIPEGKTDLLNPPKSFPVPELRYTLRDMSVIWHMYDGHDFGPQTQPPKKKVQINDGINPTDRSTSPLSPPNNSQTPCSSPTSEFMSGVASFSKSNPQEVRFGVSPPINSPQPRRQATTPLSWQARGGPGRAHDILMELQLNKVRFQHEVYPENTKEASRQVLLIHEVEVRDRLATSEINKFLYQYTSEARPRQSHANMVVIKALHLRPDPKLPAKECCLKVSLLPLRLNIDQDSLLFLYRFFSEISGNQVDADDENAQNSTPRHTTPTHQNIHQMPVMTVNIGEEENLSVPTEKSTLLIQLEEDERPFAGTQSTENSNAPSTAEDSSDDPIYFRSFVFSPEVPIRLDYQGRHVDMTHGPLAGLLMGLGQLNCSELKLKKFCHRHGLLGMNKLLSHALKEWMQDIRENQLGSILGGVGPMPALVQLVQGVRDLFWLPIEQYQKDGRIVRGLQRGANSFTTSTAWATLELTSRLVHAIQCTAETAYDMLSPGPSVRQRAIGGARGKNKRRKRYNQPVDIREGVANAYMLVKDGIGETAQTIVRVASEEHEQKGVSGAVGGVLRQIPPTVVKPVILLASATHNVIGGMQSQLNPDARREAAERWRQESD